MSRLLITLTLLLALDARGAWMQRYHEIGSVTRAAVAGLPDGRAVVASTSMTAGNLLVVVDSQGRVTASRAIDGSDVMLVAASRAGEIFLGIKNPDAPSPESIVKLRSDLSVAWTREIRSDTALRISAMAATSDGGVVATGAMDTYAVIARLDARGNVVWATRLDGSGPESISAIAIARNGDVLAGGAAAWPWLIRLRSDGELLWQRGYGPSRGWIESVSEAKDGSLVATGTFNAMAVVMKTNARGEVSWSKTSASVRDRGLSVVHVADRVMAATRADNGVRIVALRGDGSVEWARLFAPEDHPVYGSPGELLAVAGRQAVLAPAFLDDLALFSIDPASGPPACAFFTDTDFKLVDMALRDEALVVEVSKLRLHSSSPGEITMRTLSVKATPHDCFLAASPYTQPPPPPAKPAVAFRSREDTTALTRTRVAALLAGKYDELETEAASLRKIRTSRDPMRPNLAVTTFYDAFRDNESAPIETRLSHLRAWVAAHPQSDVARIALAHVLARAAWDARGQELDVTEMGAAIYGQRMAEAETVLAGTSKDAEQDPAWWRLRIGFAHELGRGDVREVGLRALAMFPDPELAVAVAGFLYPQWGFTHADCMQFADAAAGATKEVYGEAMYMWLVYQIRNFESPNDYKEYGVDWPRVVKGAEDLIRMNPDWPPSYHRFAVLANRYDDLDTLKKLFAMPQLDWYEDAERLWRHREVYDYVRERVAPAPARIPPPLPPNRVPPSLLSAPPVLLDSELTYGGASHKNVAFLVKTATGVAVVSGAPDPIVTVQKNFGGWTVWAPPAPKTKASLGTIITPQDRLVWRGVAWRPDGKRIPAVRPLQMAAGTPNISEMVYVILCRRESGTCHEQTVAARLGNLSTLGPVSHYTAEPAIPTTLEEVVGAPVVNANREVIGVVTGPADPTNRVMWVDPVRELLP